MELPAQKPRIPAYFHVYFRKGLLIQNTEVMNGHLCKTKREIIHCGTWLKIAEGNLQQK